MGRFNPILFDCPLPQSYYYNGTDSFGIDGFQTHIKAVFSSVPRRTFLMAIMVTLYSFLALVSIIDIMVKLFSEESKIVEEFISNLPMENFKVHRDYLILLQVFY